MKWNKLAKGDDDDDDVPSLEFLIAFVLHADV